MSNLYRHGRVLLIAGVLIVLFFTFWKLNVFPEDVNAEVIIPADVLRCLQGAHNQHVAPYNCFEGLRNFWDYREIFSTDFVNTAFVRKLWMFILSVMFNLCGYSIFTISLSSAFVSIAILFLTYALGKRLYSQEVGILAGIFLSTCTTYCMTVRASYGFTIIIVTALAVYYYLYRFLENYKRLYLIIAGVLLGIGSLDAPPQFFFIIITVILVMFFDYFKRYQNKVKGMAAALKDLAVILFVAAGVSLILTAIFAWYYNVTIFSVYHSVFQWAAQRLIGSAYTAATHKYVSAGFWESLVYALMFIKNTFFGMMTQQLDDYALQLPGVPMINALVSVFFVIGLITMFIKRSKPDRFMLVWVCLHLFIFMFLIKVETRYLVYFLPAICIISAYGLVWAVGKLPLGEYAHLQRQILYGLAILIVSVIGYREFFIVYKNNDANLRRFYNNSKIADFISKNSAPDGCVVVLGERLFSNRASIIFSLKYKPYKVIYLEGMLYDKAHAAGTSSITLEQIKEAMKDLETEAFKDNKKIFYVFSEHDIRYYPSSMVPSDLYSYVQMFKDILMFMHPGAVAVKILNYSNGDPTHSIFVVGK